jgi:hypothetical protein
LERPRKNPGNSVFKSAWDRALPVYAIGTALIFVLGSLLKTDERRSSVTLWDRSANPKRHKSPICRGGAVGVEHRSPAFHLEQAILAESLMAPNRVKSTLCYPASYLTAQLEN